MSRSILTRQEILDIVSRGETVYYKGRSITSASDPDIPADDSQILLDYPDWSLNPSAYASANAVGIDGYPIEGSPLNGQTLVFDSTNNVWEYDLLYSFKTVAISGQSDVVADSTTDTLTLVAGSNISLTTNATTDAITIAQTNSNITIAGTSTALGSSISLDTITGLTSAGNGLLKRTAANTLGVATAGTDYVSPSVLGANSGVATLDVSGKLTSTQIPDIAVVTYLGVAASQVAMLALTGQSGDWCTRSDLGTNWIITGSTPTQLSSWTQLSYPTAPVTSVNTKTGAVTLSSTDVGAQPSITANGILKGNGSGTISAATAGTDYAALAFKNIVVSGQSTVVANNAQSDLTLVAGTNITITTDATADTVTISSSASGSGTATKTLSSWSPRDNNPPATNFAALDTRNSIIVLDFSAGTANKSAVFSGVIPEGAVLTSGLRVRLLWTSTSGTTGNCRWGVQFEKMTTSLDSDSFDTSTEINAAAPATAGLPQTTTLTCTAIDSLAAGDFFRLKVFRNSLSTGNDTMSGDAELIRVELRAV